MKKMLVPALLCCLSCASAQTTTVNYAGSGLSTTACNVFLNNPQVAGLTHYAIVGGASYDGSEILLPIEAGTNPAISTGTKYSIAYPFVSGGSYIISVYWSSSAAIGGGVGYVFKATTSNTLDGSSVNTGTCTMGGTPDVNPTDLNVAVGGDGVSYTDPTVINYVPSKAESYLNLEATGVGSDCSRCGTNTYLSAVKIQSIVIKQTLPPPPPTNPEINGASTYYFTAIQTTGAGTITAKPGTTVTVTVGASGPPPSTYSVNFSCSVTLSNGSTSLSVSNSSTSATFVMPASGSVTWNGNFSEPNQDGSGYISVH